MRARDRAADRAAAGARRATRALHAEVLRLWLTAMLRLTKLAVADEIVNALAYFRLTFIAELPRLYADLEQALRAALGLAARAVAAAVSHVGTWVGGDRDGNPNVGAQTLEIAVLQQARMILAHYLDEVEPARTRARRCPGA